MKRFYTQMYPVEIAKKYIGIQYLGAEVTSLDEQAEGKGVHRMCNEELDIIIAHKYYNETRLFSESSLYQGSCYSPQLMVI